MDSKLTGIQQAKVDWGELKGELKKVNTYAEDLRFMIDDLNKAQNQTDNYIEKYLPIDFQNQILKNIKEVVTPHKYEVYHHFLEGEYE